jgi:uncharacterized protein (DUF58 family)
MSASTEAIGIGATDQPGRASMTRVRVWPNRFGWLMLVVLAVMLVGAINYGNNLGYALTFLLLGVWFAALLHGYRNVKGVEVIGSRAQPVFVGDAVRFDVFVRNRGRLTAQGLFVGDRGGEHSSERFSIPAQGTHCASLFVPARRRGMLVVDGAQLRSLHPLATTIAATPIREPVAVIVYPRPAGSLSLPIGEDTRVYAPGTTQSGTDDFAGLRGYRSGDSLGQIDWKVMARERGLHVKLFAGGGSEVAHLGLRDLGHIADMESRLSQLARWVIDAEQAGIPYSLELDDTGVQLGLGEPHRDACLRLLALAHAP